MNWVQAMTGSDSRSVQHMAILNLCHETDNRVEYLPWDAVTSLTDIYIIRIERSQIFQIIDMSLYSVNIGYSKQNR
jgi:hypothetical protein